MVRSYWIGPVFGVLASTGLAWGQTATPSAPAPAGPVAERFITVQESGKPGQKCKILKMWTEPDGTLAYQVQSLDSGELMTIEEPKPAAATAPAGALRSVVTRICHWGAASESPPTSPEPPPGALVVGQPVNIHSPLTAPTAQWPSAYAVNKTANANVTPTGKPTPAAPVVLSPVVVKAPDASAAKSPAAVTKVETSPSSSGDLRESWGKIVPPKPAPVHTDVLLPAPTVALAPKTELPHSQAKADDPLQSPDKYVKSPLGDDSGFTPPSVAAKKTPLLAMLAFNQPPATLKVEEKKPESPLPPPLTPMTMAAHPAVAPVSTAPPPPVAPVTAAPPPPITPMTPLPTPMLVTANVAPAAAPVAPAAPPALKPLAAETKPTVPLGMQSVLAAGSPELAPPAPRQAPQKTAPSRAEAATGIRADEPNAFTEQRAGGNVAMASNAFSGAADPGPAANARMGAENANAFLAPQRSPSVADDALVMQTAAPPSRGNSQAGGGAPAAGGGVIQASYRQEPSPEVSQMAGIMRGSLYPSQREWAAERLASLDWHGQPQILDLLTERAKEDPAPTVRVECLRSLGRMKANTLAVVAVLKALQADSDPRVRQQADEAYSEVTGTTTGANAAPSN